jgi:hypothetical protein
MHLNPEKCTFRVRSRKLLGYLVSQWGIEANTKNVWAIKEMKPLTTTSEEQMLMCCLTAIRCFISKSA